VVARCRKDRLEPPAPGQIAWLVGKAINTFEERFCAATVGRLSAATRSRLDDLSPRTPVRTRTARVAGARSSPS
jgi:hypothetical protein